MTQINNLMLQLENIEKEEQTIPHLAEENKKQRLEWN